MQMQSKERGRISKVKECNGFGNSGSPLDIYNSSPYLKKDFLSGSFQNIGSSDEHDDDVQSCANASNQIVVYRSDNSDTSQALSVPDPIEQDAFVPQSVAYNFSSKILPSIGAFTVQCAECFKWRLIPTKEKYEEIREFIMMEPFVCSSAREWRPNITCDDPADISQDGSRLWAIDKPSISQPPPGWQRLLRIRGVGSTKFADVYYVAPTGKRFRSMVEVQKFLLEHPEFFNAGVSLSQFSFQVPRPLNDNYVRKRSYAKTIKQFDAPALKMPMPQEPALVNPISWAGPSQNTALQLIACQNGSSVAESEAPVLNAAIPRTKKQATRRPSKQMYASPRAGSS